MRRRPLEGTVSNTYGGMVNALSSGTEALFLSLTNRMLDQVVALCAAMRQHAWNRFVPPFRTGWAHFATDTRGHHAGRHG